jgi:hypothetical protein
MGRPTYWKKGSNGLDHVYSRIKKFTHFFQGSPSGRFVHFPGRKPKLYLASIHGLSAPSKPQLRKLLGGN